MHSQEEIDDFLEKVNETYDAVKDIVDGKIDMKELDRREKQKEEK
jgi:hypothetical protein